MGCESPVPQAPYRLDELGWLQFDRLCALVVETEFGLAGLSWRGQSDRGRFAVVSDERVVVGPRGVRLLAPVMVAALWVRSGRSLSERLSELVDRAVVLFAESGMEVENGLLVLTNLDAGLGELASTSEAVGRAHVEVIGARQIAAILDRNPELRAAVPSVLGLRDLGALIDGEALGRSSLDVSGAQELARVFWATRAYERARAVLARHRFVVLTGPPEMGKTAIAQMLALAQLTDGWEAHECTDPDQVWGVFDRDRRQVFVADDAFGSTEYRPDSAERWAHGLGRLLGMLDFQHWLIWTSRPAPLRAGLRRVQRERGSERFPAPAEVLVDASNLDLAEKTLILFRHAKAHGASGAVRELLRSAALSIVEHPHFTPERIRRFVADRLEELPALGQDGPAHLLATVERELASPTDAMRTSFTVLGQEHRDLLIALLDAPAGLIDERELAATVRRHHAGGLSRAPNELIDRLADHFVRITPLGIGWVHPSWRDLVIEQLRADQSARQRFLAASGIYGLTLALSGRGGASGERTLPLLISDADWDQLGDRVRELLPQFEDQELARLLLELERALSEVRDPGQAREARSLAAYVLGSAQRAWDQRRRALPVFLIEAWHALNGCLPERVDPPPLAQTWAELHPGALLLERPDRSELIRAEEWLTLAQILFKHDPDALEAFGFPERDRDLLERLILILTRTATADDELRPLAEAVLARIEHVVPDLATGAHSAIEIAGLVEELERKRWWAPHDIPAPPSAELVKAAADFKPDDVDRVLRDL